MAWGKSVYEVTIRKPNMPQYWGFNMQCEQVKMFAHHIFLKIFT